MARRGRRKKNKNKKKNKNREKNPMSKKVIVMGSGTGQVGKYRGSSLTSWDFKLVDDYECSECGASPVVRITRKCPFHTFGTRDPNKIHQMEIEPHYKPSWQSVEVKKDDEEEETAILTVPSDKTPNKDKSDAPLACQICVHEMGSDVCEFCTMGMFHKGAGKKVSAREALKERAQKAVLARKQELH